jgi:hypothetical protein
MNGNTNSRTSGQERTGSADEPEHSTPNDRDAYLASLATAVGMDYTTADFEMAGTWTWDEGGSFQTVYTQMQEASGGVEGPICDVQYEPAHFEAAEAEVRYTIGVVQIHLNASGEDALLAMSGGLTNAQARELALGLWQAAQERDWRDGGETDE